MSDVANLLSVSRAAHRAGRALLEKRDFVKAREHFAVALDQRLKARALDAAHVDPAWGDDLKALHSRREFDRDLGRRLLKKNEHDPDPLGYDQPSMLVLPQLERIDRDLEAYYRQQLGESANTVSQTDLQTPGAVIAPHRWMVTTLGQIPNCAHLFVLSADKSRRICQTCDQVEDFLPMKMEETLAFQQLQRESKGTA